MRRLATVLATLAGLVLVAPAAFAHEEINPKTFPTGQPTFLTLSAANEAKADLIKIVLAAPKGAAFGAATREPAGWTVSRTDDQITWSGGAVKPDHFEQWSFEIEGADQPGTLAYKVTLGFAGGKTDEVEVDVTAFATTTPGATGAGPTGTGATTTPPTTSVVTTTTGPTQSAAGAKSTNGQKRADAALGVSVVALILAAAALAQAARGRSAGKAPAGGDKPGKAQDW
jgi:hypothetical protein